MVLKVIFLIVDIACVFLPRKYDTNNMINVIQEKKKKLNSQDQDANYFNA